MPVLEPEGSITTSLSKLLSHSLYSIRSQIDPLLTPTGKKLQDGTRAVARQLANDILPSLTRPPSSSSLPSTPPFPPNLFRPPPPDEITKVGSRIFNALQTTLQKGLQNLQQDLQDPVNAIPQRLTRQTEDFLDQAKNVVAETPVGLQEPPYTVVATTDEYEIRDYAAYKVAATNIPMVGSSTSSSSSSTRDDEEMYYSPDRSLAPTGAAFNSLAAYLLGANRQNKVLDMTTPVTTTMTGEMRFYLAVNDDDDDDNPPEPLEQDESKNVYETGTIRVVDIPAARLAVRRFTGFCTSGEIARQKEALLAALVLDGTYELDVAHGQTVGHVIFQYNPPYTIPVLRRNEIAVPILLTNDDDDEASGIDSDEVDGAAAVIKETAAVNGSSSSISDSWVSPSDS